MEKNLKNYKVELIGEYYGKKMSYVNHCRVISDEEAIEASLKKFRVCRHQFHTIIIRTFAE